MRPCTLVNWISCEENPQVLIQKIHMLIRLHKLQSLLLYKARASKARTANKSQRVLENSCCGYEEFRMGMDDINSSDLQQASKAGAAGACDHVLW